MTQADDLIAAHRDVEKGQLNKQEWLETAAAVQHEIWSHWMKYFFTQCKSIQGGWVFADFKATRWIRQMNTPYSELSEKERDSDRDQAKKVRDALMANGFYVE